MSRLRWPDSTNSVSEKPGTIQDPILRHFWKADERLASRLNPRDRPRISAFHGSWCQIYHHTLQAYNHLKT